MKLTDKFKVATTIFNHGLRGGRVPVGPIPSLKEYPIEDLMKELGKRKIKIKKENSEVLLGYTIVRNGSKKWQEFQYPLDLPSLENERINLKGYILRGEGLELSMKDYASRGKGRYQSEGIECELNLEGEKGLDVKAIRIKETLEFFYDSFRRDLRESEIKRKLEEKRKAKLEAEEKSKIKV